MQFHVSFMPPIHVSVIPPHHIHYHICSVKQSNKFPGTYDTQEINGTHVPYHPIVNTTWVQYPMTIQTKRQNLVMYNAGNKTKQNKNFANNKHLFI